MKPFDELKREQIAKQLKNKQDKWLGLSTKYRHSNDPEEKVDLAERMQIVEAEIRELEKALTECDEAGWQGTLHKIDFDRAEEAIRPVIHYYKQSGTVATLLLQESGVMMGEYCLLRLKDEWLSSVNHEISHLRIHLNSPDEHAIFQSLKEYLGYSEDGLGPEDILRGHCKRLVSGLLFISFHLSDTLKRYPQFLSIVREKLHNQFEKILQAECEDFGPDQVLLLLVAENALHDGCGLGNYCCSTDDYDASRMLQIPTEEWDEFIVSRWVENLSGLKSRMSRRERTEFVDEVMRSASDRSPRNIDTVLKEKLSRYTTFRMIY